MAEKTTPIKRLWDLIYIEKREITSIYFYAILSGLVQLSVPLGVQAIIGFVLGASMVTSICFDYSGCTWRADGRYNANEPNEDY